MVMPVTFSVLEKMSGMSSTPTPRDFAVRKGEGLNLGSSLMTRFFAVIEPERIERLRSPSSTLRPRDFDAVSSIVGRKLFTGMRNGATRSKTTTATTAMRRMRSLRPIKTSGELRLGKSLLRRVDSITRSAPKTVTLEMEHRGTKDQAAERHKL